MRAQIGFLRSVGIARSCIGRLLIHRPSSQKSRWACRLCFASKRCAYQSRLSKRAFAKKIRFSVAASRNRKRIASHGIELHRRFADHIDIMKSMAFDIEPASAFLAIDLFRSSIPFAASQAVADRRSKFHAPDSDGYRARQRFESDSKAKTTGGEGAVASRGIEKDGRAMIRVYQAKSRQYQVK